MSKLCEAFNRINSKFGANRVRLISFGDEVHFSIDGFGKFMFQDVFGLDCFELVDDEYIESPNGYWLEAIANGKVRDSDGNMVDPENQVSKESKVWTEAC